MRFPEFSGEWEQYSFGRITELFSRRNKERTNYPMYSVTNSKGFVNQQEQFEDRDMKGEDIAAYKIIFPGEFAYNPARINVGSIARYDGESACMISSLYVCFRSNRELVDSKLLLHILKSPRMVYNYGINGEGGVRIYLFYPNFSRIKVKLPSLKEQRKLAVFLDLIEERISKQNKVIEDLLALKESITSKLFKSHEGDRKTLGDVTEIFSNRNKGRIQYPMYSVTNDKGFILQTEQFEDREMTGEDISAYKIIENGDIAYNPARINVGSIAKYDGEDKCMISSLYVCIRAKKGINANWLMHILKSKQMIFKYNLYAEGGVRLYLFYPNFSRIQLFVPPYNRQIQIASTLDVLESKILVERSILSSLVYQKNYLLTNLFV